MEHAEFSGEYVTVLWPLIETRAEAAGTRALFSVHSFFQLVALSPVCDVTQTGNHMTHIMCGDKVANVLLKFRPPRSTESANRPLVESRIRAFD